MSEPGINPRAGELPEPADLVDVERLLAAYYEQRPDPSDPLQHVGFGTSGHRGSSLSGTFTDAHVAAISEAVCRYREGEGIDGPLYLGRDTHALSEPAFRTIVEVLAAHGVDAVVDARDTPSAYGPPRAGRAGGWRPAPGTAACSGAGAPECRGGA
jgi:phosphoglucomutase